VADELVKNKTILERDLFIA